MLGIPERPQEGRYLLQGVSTSDQDNDRQERDLLDYAERANFEVIQVFKETLS